MRKITNFIFVAILAAFVFVGCGKENYTVFPENYTLAGVNVGGMTPDEAKTALEAAAGEYSLTVKLNGHDIELSGEELAISLKDVDLESYMISANKGEEVDEEIFEISAETDVASILSNNYYAVLSEAAAGETTEGAEATTGEEVAGDAAADATAGDEAADSTEAGASEREKELELCKASNLPRIAYDAASNTFIGVDGITCDILDYSDAIAAIEKAVAKLEATATAETKVVNAEGVAAADSEEVAAAIADANAYLGLELSVLFELEGYKSNTTVIAPTDVAQWLQVENDGLTIAISEETLSNYCNEIASQHDKSKYRSVDFQTTEVGVIQISIPVAGKRVDANVLFEDILKALQDKKSTEVKAVFVDVDDSGFETSTDFGGNYCEVDLDHQKVYVYKNHELVVTSGCVTGCVVLGHYTPSGVYEIFSKDKDRYLRGADYISWVNFFLPFNGGIGFHDASWRGEFGGNIYLYNGSHGCINMPYSAVKKLYENVTVGTKVVLYGGQKSIGKMEQTWTGSSTQNATYGDGGFYLGVGCQGNVEVTYSSSNDSVASVDGSGYVSVNGVGSCTITAHSTENNMYLASNYSITINVGKANATVTATATPSSVTGETGSATQTVIINGTASNGAGLTYSMTENTCPAGVSFNASTKTLTVDYTNPALVPGNYSVKITVSAGATSTHNGASTVVTIPVTVTAPPVAP